MGVRPPATGPECGVNRLVVPASRESFTPGSGPFGTGQRGSCGLDRRGGLRMTPGDSHGETRPAHARLKRGPRAAGACRSLGVCAQRQPAMQLKGGPTNHTTGCVCSRRPPSSQWHSQGLLLGWSQSKRKTAALFRNFFLIPNSVPNVPPGGHSDASVFSLFTAKPTDFLGNPCGPIRAPPAVEAF